MGERVPRVYATVMIGATPIVRWWGRLTVVGAELLPESGPTVLMVNHDSEWDPVVAGVAVRRRQIRALAKSSLWKVKGLGPILDGMGQIPIDRGTADTGALNRAIEELRAGACIGVFPEGTRSLGRELRARSGFGRLAEAVPEAAIVLCSIKGTTDVPRFPKRPHIRLRFFLPAEGGLQPGERASDFTVRLLKEIRAGAPITHAGRRPRTPA